MKKLIVLLCLPGACVELDPEFVEPIDSIQADSCVNALSEYEDCDWGAGCQKVIPKDYPESWEAARLTYAMCYFQHPRCEGLREGCEGL